MIGAFFGVYLISSCPLLIGAIFPFPTVSRPICMDKEVEKLVSYVPCEKDTQRAKMILEKKTR